MPYADKGVVPRPTEMELRKPNVNLDGPSIGKIY